MGEQRRVPLPRRMRPVVEVVKRAPGPEPFGDPEIRRVRFERDRVGAVGLDLDGIGARLDAASMIRSA